MSTPSPFAREPISQTPPASLPLTGNELVPLVQGGVTCNTAVSAFLSSAAPVGPTGAVQFKSGGGTFAGRTEFEYTFPTLQITTPSGLNPAYVAKGDALGAPIYELLDESAGVDAKRWWILASGGVLQIFAVLDDGNPSGFGFQMTRAVGAITQTLLLAGTRTLGINTNGSITINGGKGAPGQGLISAGPVASATWGDVGYIDIPQNIQNADYAFALSDRGKHVYHTVAGANTYDIPTNATTAFPIGAVITVVAGGASGDISIAPAGGVTLRQAGTGSTGTRTLAADGECTLLKVDTDEWKINGVGLT